MKKIADVALVADIHFTPKVALKVAESWDKIRVNPGNFADGLRNLMKKYAESREEYDEVTIQQLKSYLHH